MERERVRALIRVSVDQAAVAVAASRAMAREAATMRTGLQDQISAAHERTMLACDRLRRLSEAGEIG